MRWVLRSFCNYAFEVEVEVVLNRWFRLGVILLNCARFLWVDLLLWFEVYWALSVWIELLVVNYYRGNRSGSSLLEIQSAFDLVLGLRRFAFVFFTSLVNRILYISQWNVCIDYLYARSCGKYSCYTFLCLVQNNRFGSLEFGLAFDSR